jgi:hypothetical protein
MATMYGGLVREWLLERGWCKAPILDSDDLPCGDAQVLDPQNDQELNVYVALKVHQDRTGEFPEFLPDNWKVY